MKKIVLSLSLIIGGLSINGDCFAINQENAFNANQHQQSNGLVPVKSIASNAKKALKRKDVQIALGTAAVIGSGVAAYYFVPGVSDFVNSNAKAALDVVKNSDQYRLVSSKLLEMGKEIKYSSKIAVDAVKNSDQYKLVGSKLLKMGKEIKYSSKIAVDAAKIAVNTVKNSDQYKLVSSKLEALNKTIKLSKAFKSMESSKIGNIVKNRLGIKSASIKGEKFVGEAKGTLNSAQPYLNAELGYGKSAWNNIQTWAKCTAAGVVGTVAAGSMLYSSALLIFKLLSSTVEI